MLHEFIRQNLSNTAARCNKKKKFHAIKSPKIHTQKGNCVDFRRNFQGQITIAACILPSHTFKRQAFKICFVFSMCFFFHGIHFEILSLLDGMHLNKMSNNCNKQTNKQTKNL